MLDEARIESAKSRARLELEAERRALNSAKAARAKAQQLAKTWQFDLREVECVPAPQS